MITGLPPCLCAIPGPLVDTGSSVARVCDVETEAVFAEGEGDDEGDGDGEGEGTGVGEGTVSIGCD